MEKCSWLVSAVAVVIGFIAGVYTTVALVVGLFVLGQGTQSSVLVGILAVSTLLLGLATVTHVWGMERLSMSYACEALFLFLSTVLLVAIPNGEYEKVMTGNAAVAVTTMCAVGGSSGRLVYAVIMRWLGAGGDR